MNKTLNVIKKTVVWLIVLLAIAMMIFTLATMLTCNQTERDLLDTGASSSGPIP